MLKFISFFNFKSNLIWSSLKHLNNNRLITTSYYWMIITPITAKLLDNVEESVKIGELSITLSLPFSWTLFFFSATCFSFANLIFFWKCPEIIKKFENCKDYLSHKLPISYLLNHQFPCSDLTFVNLLNKTSKIEDIDNEEISKAIKNRTLRKPIKIPTAFYIWIESDIEHDDTGIMVEVLNGYNSILSYIHKDGMEFLDEIHKDKVLFLVEKHKDKISNQKIKSIDNTEEVFWFVKTKNESIDKIYINISHILYSIGFISLSVVFIQNCIFVFKQSGLFEVFNSFFS